MAERIVIARLEVQEDGAVRAIQSTQQSIGSLERQTKQSADVITQRLFNARTAAAAFLGTFTAAGAVMAFKSFVTEVFKAQSGFKAFSADADNAKRQVLLLAGDVFHVNDALGGMSAWLERISGSIALFRSSGNADKAGVLWSYLFGATQIGQMMQLLGLAGQVIDKAAPGLRGAGKEPYIPRAVKLDQPPNLADTVRGFADEQAWQLAPGPWMIPEGDVREQTRAWLNLNEVMTEYGRIVEEDVIGPTAQLQFEMDAAAERLNFWQSTITAGMSLIGNAIADQGMTARKAVGALLETMSQVAFMFAAVHFAAAVGATTGLGAALTGGTPSMHAKSAAKWAAVGALTAVAASHFGGEGGSSAGAAAGDVSQQSLAPQTRPVNVTLVIEGHVIGDDAFVRGITNKIKKSLADGSAGGSFS
jgi:hypothetical protein